MGFSIETFVGLHIYLVAADLIYNILDKFMSSLYENLLSPFIDMLLGENFFAKLKWTVGEDKTIDLGAILAEGIKVFFLALFAFYMYQYFQKYAKFHSLKK